MTEDTKARLVLLLAILAGLGSCLAAMAAAGG